MVIKNCPFCGTKLSKTSLDRNFCPNCGIIEEEEKVEDSEKGYIG